MKEEQNTRPSLSMGSINNKGRRNWPQFSIVMSQHNESDGQQKEDSYCSLSKQSLSTQTLN